MASRHCTAILAPSARARLIAETRVNSSDCDWKTQSNQTQKIKPGTPTETRLPLPQKNLARRHGAARYSRLNGRGEAGAREGIVQTTGRFAASKGPHHYGAEDDRLRTTLLWHSLSRSGPANARDQ